MSTQIALYGFVRYRDGLRVRPLGIQQSRCYLYYAGGDMAAVISTLPEGEFKPSLSSMASHDEAIEKIFSRQTLLPAKYPKVLSLRELERSMVEGEKDITEALRKILYKSEFRVKIFLSDKPVHDPRVSYFNAISKHIIENSSQSRYRHYFPVMTDEGKEAVFMHYTESVLQQISQKLSHFAKYWRIRSFQSEKVLLDSFFWVRKPQVNPLMAEVKRLKLFYPNLCFSVMGPYPPYNFAEFDFQKNPSL